MVIPSIDLSNGRAVQLRQGREKVLERKDVIPLARHFNKYGEIALIDLDAAMGKGNNTELIRRILKISECRVGGGISDVDYANQLIGDGATKIIVGSAVFAHDRINHKFLHELVGALGRGRVIIAIDAMSGEIVTSGWKHRTGLQLQNVISELEEFCSEFLFTCVEREGLLDGTDLDRARLLRKKTHNALTLAGGIHTLEEIRACAGFNINVQLGMALYKEVITLTDAFIESLQFRDGLIPTITQDHTGQVLMLAYSNRASLQKTFNTGYMHYFSRSRQALWKKGETSGNTQQLIKMRVDCDCDTILASVLQLGPACHTLGYSCFGEKKFSLQELYDIIEDRTQRVPEDSYTGKLTMDSIRAKLKEEVEELVNAGEGNDVIWETADLLYFITVMLAKQGILLDDVLRELRRRKK